MVSTVREKIDDGRYTLESTITITDDGIMLILYGGDKSHVGTVVMSSPRPSLKSGEPASCTTSVINRISHKDDLIITPVAEAVCKKADAVVVASGGVHFNDADEADIKRLMSNMEVLIERILMNF